MVEGKWLPPGADIEPALALRRAIFSLDRDHKDACAWQALAVSEGKHAGTGRIWWEGGAFHIGMICVLPDCRGRGLGDFLTRLLLFKAQQHNAVTVILHAPPEAAPFFQRYGFLPCGGPEPDGSIPHTLSGRDIVLDACAGCARKNAP